MGHVYRAKHLRLNEDIAIKVIDKKFVSDAGAVERFNREARAAAKLRHPNVIDIRDIDQTPEPDVRPYIVMELVDGKSLKTVLRDEGRLALDRAVTLMVEMCKAVSFAHRQGVIHRDIKPDNIMVIQRDGEAGESVKVLDFGLAKMRESEEQPSITHVGTLMGTPFYMSPEQCRGEELDARSDVYSLATVLYEIISGAPPFSGDSVTSVCSKHQSAPIPALDPSLHVPAEIVKLLHRGLAKTREARPSDAQQFSQELQGAYGHLSVARKEAPLAETVKESNAAVGEPTTSVVTMVVPVIESHRTSADNVAGIDYYAFRVSLRNVSEKTIRNFRLEVEIPNAYADPTHAGSMSENVRRARENTTLYRYTQDHSRGFVLYPNDVSQILMNANYQMRFDQYEKATGEIRVSVYVDDELAGRAEYSIRDNRNKDRMVQLGIERSA
jgi:serine/threonine protein kinase